MRCDRSSMQSGDSVKKVCARARVPQVAVGHYSPQMVRRGLMWRRLLGDFWLVGGLCFGMLLPGNHLHRHGENCYVHCGKWKREVKFAAAASSPVSWVNNSHCRKQSTPCVLHAV